MSWPLKEALTLESPLLIESMALREPSRLIDRLPVRELLSEALDETELSLLLCIELVVMII